ncbi:hypothetical protein [Sphingomonas sp. DC2300-3]|uniref:hypothetical protein n=1 Tax=unclassified Sphingomonas TaxID=196159 RepID=UPI003CEDE703
MKKAALPVFLLIAIGWYADTRPHVPAASTVNGVYSNPCCGKFTISNGVVLTGNSRVPFDLENMKFGLTAFPKAEILVQDGRVQAYQDADPGPLSFDKSGTVVTVCSDRLCKRAFQFRRVSPLLNGS